MVDTKLDLKDSDQLVNIFEEMVMILDDQVAFLNIITDNTENEICNALQILKRDIMNTNDKLQKLLYERSLEHADN